MARVRGYRPIIIRCLPRACASLGCCVLIARPECLDPLIVCPALHTRCLHALDANISPVYDLMGIASCER
jgi:hypothetical protein